MILTDTKSTSSTQQTPPPGFHSNVKFETYTALPCLNATLLKNARKSMKRMKWAHDGDGIKDTDPMKLGRAAHTCLFEPDEFPIRYAIWKGGTRRGGKWDAFVEANSDREILREVDYQTALSIRKAVTSCSAAAELLADGTPEQTMVWEVEGLPFKGRVDWLRDDCFVDVKTARDVTSPWFERDFFSRAYDLQFAVYRHGIRTLTGKTLKAFVIAVEKADEMDVVVHEVPARILDDREQQMLGYVQQWKWCCERGEFPGVNEDVTELAVPAWEEPGDDLTLTIGGVDVEV